MKTLLPNYHNGWMVGGGGKGAAVGWGLGGRGGGGGGRKRGVEGKGA